MIILVDKSIIASLKLLRYEDYSSSVTVWTLTNHEIPIVIILYITIVI